MKVTHGVGENLRYGGGVNISGSYKHLGLYLRLLDYLKVGVMRMLFTLVCYILSISASAQWSVYNTVTFDDTSHLSSFRVDTVNYHHNIWQVGRPHKVHFDSAYSFPNVLVTDTAFPYHSNDTSVFYLTLPKIIYPYHHALYLLNLRYKLNIDSTAKVKLEITTDTSNTWYDLADTTPAYLRYHVDSFKNTTVWTSFSLPFGSMFSVHDSVRLKFTFIGGTDTAAHDGWMIDDMNIEYYMESVDLWENQCLLSIYPNPSTGNIYIHPANGKNGDIIVFDVVGRPVYKQHITGDTYLTLPLPAGTYTARFTSGDYYSARQIFISH